MSIITITSQLSTAASLVKKEGRAGSCNIPSDTANFRLSRLQV